ncbi:MAG: MFS transporter [Oscillospiraceae bacterium]|jgi:MFS family permease|nr:MFS transporter [Oscillospiraceae bacterium]
MNNMTYTATRRGTYSGFVVMATLGNLSPLLFIIFQDSFGLSFERLGLLIVIYFSIQIAAMFFGIGIVEKLGYRIPVVFSQCSAVLGLVLLGVLPTLMNNAFIGLIIATSLNAVGCGLIELTFSPITNALPSPKNQKASTMSFMHSFYCWGVAGTILISTLFLQVMGREMWWLIPILWAALPLFNSILFMRVPLPDVIEKKERMPAKKLLLSPLFLVFIVLMICGAASELTMGQWSSLFMEQGLGLSKVLGDIAGPCMLAILMGVGRILYSVLSNRINYRVYMAASALLCVACYLLMSLSPHPAFSLIGCALCGLAVSMMWPGTLSFAVSHFPSGGTFMFGALSIFGLLGCSLGPWVTGVVADSSDGGLRTGLLVATIFPAVIILLILLISRKKDVFVLYLLCHMLYYLGAYGFDNKFSSSKHDFLHVTR